MRKTPLVHVAVDETGRNGDALVVLEAAEISDDKKQSKKQEVKEKKIVAKLSPTKRGANTQR